MKPSDISLQRQRIFLRRLPSLNFQKRFPSRNFRQFLPKITQRNPLPRSDVDRPMKLLIQQMHRRPGNILDVQKIATWLPNRTVAGLS